MDDFVYLEDGKIKVSESAMQIPAFKELKRYDRTDNKIWFDAVISYVYYVYKIFGDKNVSYLANTPIHQRKVTTVANHTGKYKDLNLFENDSRVQAVVESYLEYSRTRSEMLFDALKADIDSFSDYIQKMPTTIKKSIPRTIKEPDGEKLIERIVYIDIEIPNSDERLKAITRAKEIDDLYKRVYKDVQKDGKNRAANEKMFENKAKIAEMNFSPEEITVSTSKS